VNSGASVGVSDMPSEPIRSGYSFGGWYTSTGGGGTQFTATTPVSGNITVYAKWTVIQYTVTFNADGGTPETQTRTVNSGASVGASDMPSEPNKSGYSFGGWYTVSGGGGTQFTETTTVSGNITVYAKWTLAVPADLSLAASLAWISGNAQEGGFYTITVKANETIAPQTLSYSGKNVRITLNGGASERTVSLSAAGSLFTVESGVTLTLDNNITLKGRSGNIPLVWVNSGGTLVMNTGSKISGNTGTNGGGVYVSGIFIMPGGTISGNTAPYVSNGSLAPTTWSGGGVYVASSGIFTMNGGTISGNTAAAGGGGVCVSGNGIFTMNGGIISGNTAASGGGVFVSGSGTFTKQPGGIIYGSEAGSTLKNTATNGSGSGHAVLVSYPNTKKRDTTAGTELTLDSRIDGSAGGWE
jgi:uncharacterized repeat protein (TIGR02543 family)